MANPHAHTKVNVFYRKEVLYMVAHKPLKNQKYYRIKTYKVLPAEPSMNILANQRQYLWSRVI